MPLDVRCFLYHPSRPPRTRRFVRVSHFPKEDHHSRRAGADVLGRIDGFEGIRELARIISATMGSTLWVVSTNQYAYRYLDAAIQFGEYFSHRINAMAVLPEALQSAILLRHNLSGLRLQYPPAPESDPRVNRIRSLLGFHREPDEIFFDRLYRQSEGIFRTAFELWQKFIERVEGGVLVPEKSNRAGLRSSHFQAGFERCIHFAGRPSTRERHRSGAFRDFQLFGRGKQSPPREASCARIPRA